MNLADRGQFEEVAESVAPGVSRVRPAVFRSFKSAPKDAPDPQPLEEGLASRRSIAQRAYQLPSRAKLAPEMPVQTAAATAQAVAAPARKAPAAKNPVVSADWEQQLAPLRSLSRELVGRGLPAKLVTELIAEIVAEYGNQVLESEQDARWALAEQVLLRIAGDPLIPSTGSVNGCYIVAGPTGSGRSLLVATIAMAAAKRGQTDIMLVNTEVNRIGAAAQMDALGKVFNCRVAHAYTADELRELQGACKARTLLLAQAAGWSPNNDTELHESALTWPLHGAKKILCLPATGQCDDLLSYLTSAKQATKNLLAALSRIGETRNVLPSIGALASARQPVGTILHSQNLTQQAVAPSLATVVRTVLGVTLSSKKRR